MFRQKDENDLPSALDRAIEADLQMGLARSEVRADGPAIPVSDAGNDRPRLVLNTVPVKLFCNFKNHLKKTYLSKDQEDDVRAFIESKCVTTDKDVEIYKLALEETGNRYASPEVIEFINKYANSPIAVVLGHEFDEMRKLKSELREFMETRKVS